MFKSNSFILSARDFLEKFTKYFSKFLPNLFIKFHINHRQCAIIVALSSRQVAPFLNPKEISE